MDGMEEFEQEGQQAHDDQGNLTPVSRPLFTVEIEKGNERLCFELELVDAHDEHGQFDYRVEEFYIAPTGSGEIDPYEYVKWGMKIICFAVDYRVEEFYIAPTGSGEIDPKVYSSSGKYIDENLYNLLFLKFLEERGIDAQFCENLVRFSTHYEHAQYVALLQKIKSFVSK
uniref:Complement component 1 Q subcomponent-binding protein, mitochondrial n=1 Tax=Plectus sambesii TaxID=2011161 RepID=A0A914X1C1_9BILA